MNMSGILSWFGVGNKAEKFHNIVKANAEINRLRGMLENIPSTGVSNEEFLNVKEAYSLLKTNNEKLIAMNQELIAEVHLATANAEEDVSSYKKSIEAEKTQLAKSMAEVLEDKRRLEMSVNQRAAELISSIGCSVDRLPPTISTENHKSVFTIKTLQQQ